MITMYRCRADVGIRLCPEFSPIQRSIRGYSGQAQSKIAARKTKAPRAAWKSGSMRCAVERGRKCPNFKQGIADGLQTQAVLPEKNRTGSAMFRPLAVEEIFRNRSIAERRIFCYTENNTAAFSSAVRERRAAGRCCREALTGGILSRGV